LRNDSRRLRLEAGRRGCVLETWGWRFSLAAATALAAVVALMVTVRAEDIAGVVATRQAAMKTLAANIKIVSDFTEGKAEQAAAIAAAQQLVTTAKSVPTLFPPGTGMEAMPGKSGAKPEIWTRQSEFAADAETLVTKLQALLGAAQTGDKSATREQLVEAGKEGCGVCHGAFRVKI
jgi:cytochrome c556